MRAQAQLFAPGTSSRAKYVELVVGRPGLLALLKYDLPIASLDLADKLATEYSVMLAPGSAFGYEHHLRLGIGQRPDIFEEGLTRAGTCLSQLAARNEQVTT